MIIIHTHLHSAILMCRILSLLIGFLLFFILFHSAELFFRVRIHHGVSVDNVDLHSDVVL